MLLTTLEEEEEYRYTMLLDKIRKKKLFSANVSRDSALLPALYLICLLSQIFHCFYQKTESAVVCIW